LTSLFFVVTCYNKTVIPEVSLKEVERLNLIKIGNSKGFCIPSRILRELGSIEKFTLSFEKESGTIIIKPEASLMDKWLKDFKEKGDDGINESVPAVILSDVLIEDLEFQPDFDGDKEQCRKKENSRNLGKCSK
jgi:antitoxin component of MazEF toxin-antitoxin module